MPNEEEDWNAAVKQSDLATLKRLISFGNTRPDGGIIQEALVTASEKDAVEAMTALLDWGTPASSRDLSGRLALHAAAEGGATKACKLLLERRAELTKTDAAGRPPIAIALAKCQLGCVKELLRAGAKLPDNASAPGLATVIKEVQAEKHIEDLKKISQSTEEVKQEEIDTADTATWAAQREHMRLLGLREEQRAGLHLVSFQQRTASELAAAEKARILEQEHQKFMHGKRVEILASKTTITEQNREINKLASEEAKADEEDRMLKAQLADREAHLATYSAQIEAKRAAIEAEQERIFAAHALFSRLTSEVAEQEAATISLRQELEAAQRELDEWHRDREAAAKLTEQAHHILHVEA